MSLFGLFGPPNVEKLKAKGDIKGLIKALDYQEDAAVRKAAANALAKISDKRAVEPLVAALSDDRFEVCMDAAEALGEIGDAQAVEPLIGALSDKRLEVRESVAKALGMIGDARAVEPLSVVLKDVSWTLGEAVAKGGDINVLILSRFEHFESHFIMLASIQAQKAAHCGDAIRKAAAWALGKIGDTCAVGALLSALRDRAVDVRQTAAEALDALGWKADQEASRAAYWIAKGEWEKCIDIGSPAIEPLIGVLMNASAISARVDAAKMLREIGWQPDAGKAGAAYWAVFGEWDKCVQIGSPAVGPLCVVLGDILNAEREGAAEALGKIRDARALAILLLALVSALEQAPLPCKSCGTVYCVDCIVRLSSAGNPCPYCNGKIEL